MQSFTCPPNCSFATFDVMGAGDFYYKSSVCRAAIHENIITDDGGNASIMLNKGFKIYEKISKNGVSTKSYVDIEYDPKSIKLTSFKIYGTHLDNIKYLVEDYSDLDLLNNYDMVDDKNSIKKPSNWIFDYFPYGKDKFMVIRNKSEI